MISACICRFVQHLRNFKVLQGRNIAFIDHILKILLSGNHSERCGSKLFVLPTLALTMAKKGKKVPVKEPTVRYSF